MRMQEITDNVIGYNNKTKHMKGILIPIDYDTDIVGVIPFSIYWKVEDVHEFIKTYKHDLLKYVGDGLVFLPLKKNKTFDDIDMDFIDDWFYDDDNPEVLEHFDFDVSLSKELVDYIEEQGRRLLDMYDYE